MAAVSTEPQVDSGTDRACVMRPGVCHELRERLDVAGDRPAAKEEMAGLEPATFG
jgi:hypothetical protein